MSTVRITISVPDEVASKAQRAVEAGKADSVSGYFAALAEREPDWVAAGEAIDEMIAEAGGIREEDRAWARAVLTAPPRRHRRVVTIVLDAGALLAVERRNRKVLALVADLQFRRETAAVPAGVVAQCWRDSPRQHAIRRLLTSRSVRIDPLDEDQAYAVGALLARTRTSDVVDAHVALLARRLRATVVTSEPDDLAALDPTLPLVVV